MNANLVRLLLTRQFPHWASLEISLVDSPSWSNCMYRLGEEMVVRLPRAPDYAAQILREYAQLTHLQSASLPVAIPKPLAIGKPQVEFDMPWCVFDWIPGETALPSRVAHAGNFVSDLVRFLKAVHGADTAGGLPPGAHNFHRGAGLAVYGAQTEQAIERLGSQIDGHAALAIWRASLATRWELSPVWVHGDLSVGNLLVRNGKLCAVIDFGNTCIGDPACDLAIAWSVFDAPQRQVLRNSLALDPATWQRGKAWALWKALILAAGTSTSNAFEAQNPTRTIQNLLLDPTA